MIFNPVILSFLTIFYFLLILLMTLSVFMKNWLLLSIFLLYSGGIFLILVYLSSISSYKKSFYFMKSSIFVFLIFMNFMKNFNFNLSNNLIVLFLNKNIYFFIILFFIIFIFMIFVSFFFNMNKETIRLY